MQLMSLGLFVFELATLPFSEMQRRSDWRHPASDRVGAPPAAQYVGRGEDNVTLSGVLMPEAAGTLDSIEQLRAMADAGDAYPLIDGRGVIIGLYVITALDERKSHFLDNGVARKTDFALDLRRVD
ncbi:MAG: phage tail protein [Sphingobium sp.]|uniref:phage tail protein n=1 Tax=Sphingobium sp. TaxID=1912891 RepID=UPI003BB01D90